jgi:hypothetical protein
MNYVFTIYALVVRFRCNFEILRQEIGVLRVGEAAFPGGTKCSGTR